MDEAPPPPADIGAADRLLTDLLAVNEEVEVSAREMAGLVRLPSLPEHAVLSAARLRFSRALRRHLQLVDGAIQSRLRTASENGDAGVHAYRQLLHGYHGAAAHHIACWESASVANDWDGYCRSVENMLVLLRQRLAAERRDIHPLLAGLPSRL